MTSARELKLDRLYRYRPHRADELRLLLEGNQLRFSNANFFNDPWDCRPLIRIPVFRPEDQQAEDERWIDWLVSIHLEHRTKDAKSAEQYRALLRADRSKLKDDVEKAGASSVYTTRERYRILCLSTHCDIPLMWSLYADAHRGLVEIFDAADEVIGQARDIIYLPSCPSIDFPDPNVDAITPAFMTKADYWEQESEFRIIAKEGVDAASGFIASHQGYVTVKSTALVGVILGCQMSSANRAEAVAILRAAKHKIEIYNALLDPESYRLRIVAEEDGTSNDPNR